MDNHGKFFEKSGSAILYCWVNLYQNPVIPCRPDTPAHENDDNVQIEWHLELSLDYLNNLDDLLVGWDNC